jgi:C-terminal processing protease CtpA/Prc
VGVVERGRAATFRLRAPKGATTDVELDPIAIGDHRTGAAGAAWLPSRPLPAYRCRRTERHWVAPAPDGTAVHVGYNVTRGDTTAFARDVEAMVTSSKCRAVILDLRLNGGGDNRTYQPVLESLERLATATRLAVLTSRTTFSAAMQLVVDLEQRTPAVFVGEPTGGSPNQYGDAIPVELPRSGRRAHVATIEWLTSGAGDERLTREPDLRVATGSTSFFSGEDLTLVAALDALS